ncbi:MAG: hypothetical protein NTW86_08335 [Candidatus Sumerlaeota bacterium]|nr:hypothetical protein [Candidatus Sumerlaeota bacterium]
MVLGSADVRVGHEPHPTGIHCRRGRRRSQEPRFTAPADWRAFLDPARAKASREYAGFDPALDPLIDETIRRTTANPALLALAWHCYYVFQWKWDCIQFQRWPSLDGALGELWGMFYLIIGLTAVPRTREIQQKLGIPERYTRADFDHLPESMDRFALIHPGKRGIAPNSLNWMHNHMAGDLHRMGRFNYMLKPFRCLALAYRHRETGEVVALAADETRFTPEGFIERGSEEETWTATLAEDDEAIAGYPISPQGFAVRTKISLPKREWARALQPGDIMIEVHIPAGGGMTPEVCRDTMAQALDFFPRYFPGKPFAGFCCTSWILNTQLQEMFPPEANLVRFQKELYLLPLASSGRDGLHFIFAQDQIDLATAPRDTSLRRAFLDHLAAGKRLRNGGMFLLTDDFQRFGSQPYLRQWPPKALRGQIPS